MQIFVPTRGRIDRQHSMQNFKLDKQPYQVTYVVPWCDEEAFRKAWPGRSLLMVSDDWRFSDIRQYLLQVGDPYQVCMDDDQRYFGPNPIEAMELCEELMLHGNFVHGGIGSRSGNKIDPEWEWKTNALVSQVHFYNASALREIGFDFRVAEVAQDRYCTAKLLCAGFPNAVITSHLKTSVPGPSIVDRYRTDELRLRAYERIIADLPPKVAAVRWKGDHHYLHINLAKAIEIGDL